MKRQIFLITVLLMTAPLPFRSFAVGFASPAGYGVVAYTVGADGSLDGTWTGAGGTKTGAEILKSNGSGM